MKSLWLGRLDYGSAFARQVSEHAAVRAGAEDIVLGVEHPAVITLGVRGRRDADLCASGDAIPVVETDRGGQATLHSEGQLVIYPIVDLRRNARTPRAFVRALLDATADWLNAGGIDAFVSEERAGVYTAKGKIAFCGLRLERGVSRHGISINVRNDLGLFAAIRPCGVNGGHLTTMAEFGRALPLEPAFATWCGFFERRLPAAAVPSPSELPLPSESAP